ncbi:MAG: hypothetical protein IAG13_18555 [Deltaproteobacteria bacterium]|nr:hypothetical protein [Nannocystaceae bacterium]
MKLTKAVLLTASLGAFATSTTACDKPEEPKKEDKKAEKKEENKEDKKTP